MRVRREKKDDKKEDTHTHIGNIYTKQLNTLQWLAGIHILLLPSHALSSFSFVTDVLLIRVVSTVLSEHSTRNTLTNAVIPAH